jgi:predicted nucleotidyltransferase
MDLSQALLSCVDLQPELKRRLKVMGLITKALEPYCFAPVIVGGTAVEFYSLGGYMSYDVDVVVSNREVFGQVLENLDFIKKGRHWGREDLDIVIEAPSSDLSQETAPLVVVVVDGFKVSILGVEDLIIDRVNAAVHWQSKEDEKWSAELVRLSQDKLDWAYLKRRASDTNVKDFLHKLAKDYE